VRPELSTICQHVLARLKELESASFQELAARPEFETVDTEVSGRMIRYNTYRATAPDGTVLIVVQGWYPTWKFPTFISFQVVGHMVADGFIKHPNGQAEIAPDDVMWAFR
jgi:hypothetical protein